MSLTVSIPSDHPKAPVLRRLFAAFSTMQRLESGLILDSGQTNDAAVEEVINVLRDIVAEEGIDLDAEVRRAVGPGQLRDGLRDMGFVASIAEKILTSGRLRASDRYIDHARDLLRRIR